ncbi:DNA helicase [Favolaschia claudopus]|uniref:DNA helicase n=1 Tax=Favolaschia claudopus TaxID=2862362 RepID=A0AAW0E7G7_9AGAR
MAETEPDRPRKRRKEKETDLEALKPRKKKRTRDHNTVADDADPENPQVEVAAAPAEDPAPDSEKPRKKKRKNRTGFPDPSEDPTLSEQASKALCYAFSQFHKSKHTQWKFSKARQNWLIRNIWSDKIPDDHLPLTIQYLSNVQGGVRETLLKECRSQISASEKVSAEEAPPAEASALGSLSANAQRARALLGTLEKELDSSQSQG